ncbi:MAG: 3'(2'),5'-bisphosphate nucleotidase CysQ [Phycisphaerae bacterium]|nr:3'(2'),5'-bisphosphate nucleotidase CysQ [Phycisphaerae bacterium]
MTREIDSSFLCDLARRAGAAILEVARGGELGVEYKSDETPLTRADRASHDIIVSALRETTPGIPVISEEDAERVPFAKRAEYKKFWIVDPLDGTKEFVRNRADYTVNIGLVSGAVPVMGVVYAPVRDWTYFGQTHPDGTTEAFKQIGDETPQPLPLPENAHEEIVAVRSRSHAVDGEEDILAKFSPARTVSMGSSLKFCLLAEGQADVYYRAGPTWEWDTAAADAVLRAAGGITLTPDGKEPLPYNKPSGKNENGFLAFANPKLRARLD